LNVLVGDDPTQDWATIGVKVLSISLTPQGGGNDVTVFTAASPAPTINLLQLDQLNEILESATIPAGTYTAATLTLSGNAGDVLLVASANPETGFASRRGEHRPFGPDPDPWHARQFGQPDRAGEADSSICFDGHGGTNYDTRFGLRPVPPRVHRGACAAGKCSNHDVGGQF